MTLPTTTHDRRTVLRGVGLAGAGALTVAACAACGSGEDDASTAAGSGDVAASDPIDPATVPVGGGLIIQASKAVVTQPTAGVFKAFTAVCTHKQCIVAKVENNTIECTCHGSMFDATTGAVKGGPAPAPLAEKKVTEGADGLTIA